MYIPAYRTLSEPVYGHADVMQAYLNGGAPIWPVGPDATDRSMWWAVAVTLFAQASLVCHTVLGAPRRGPREPTTRCTSDPIWPDVLLACRAERERGRRRGDARSNMKAGPGRDDRSGGRAIAPLAAVA